MQFLLVSSPHRDTFGYSMPPPGLLRLGGAMEREGLPVALLDGAHEVARGAWRAEHMACDASAAILEHARRVGGLAAVGFSTMGATLPVALAIAARLRAAGCEAPIWFGGPGVGGIELEILRRFGAVDVVVRGEAEETIVSLARARLEGRGAHGIAGCHWRDEHGLARAESPRAPLADLSRLPPMAWHLLPPIKRYKEVTGEEEGLVPVDSGRGCVYDCSFCSIGRWWGRRSRPLPARMLADEVCGILAMEGARTAYLCHDLFAANRAHAVAFCSEMVARGAPLAWEARCRADHLDRELLALMRKAGCWRVLLGIESGDAGVREAANKGMRSDVDLLRVVEDCAATGIVPILSILLGLPGEGEAELESTLLFASRASLLAGVNLSFHLPNPQPGCALGDEHGARAVRLAGIQPDMAFGAGESADERALLEAHPDLFTTFALLPRPEAELRELAALAQSLPELLMRFPRTFALWSRRHGGVLAGWRAWRASRRSLEACVRATRDEVLESALALEHAQLRAVAQAGGGRGAACGGAQEKPASDAACRAAQPAADQARVASRGVRCRATLLETRLDPQRATRALLEDAPVELESRPRALAIAAEAKRVTTMALSTDARRVLELLDGRSTLAELSRSSPGLAAAARALAARGLVDLGEDDAAIASAPSGVEAPVAPAHATAAPRSTKAEILAPLANHDSDA
ncbi:MAG: hypothetical protein RL112_2204 [Planctomycetota bacterium]